MISSTARRLSAAIRPCVRTKGRVIAPALATGAMSLMATAAGFTRAAPGVARVPHVRALSSSPAAQRSVAQDAADYVKSRLPEGFTPKLGLVLGSGLGPVGDIIEDAVRIPYSEIPDFPVSTVSGHAGELVCGTLEGVPVVALKGRVHLYEGVDPANLRIPIYTFKLIGAEAVFLTSAVGSTREDVGPGELVAVTDHINMQMRNVLIGPNDDAIGTRFPSMKDAYDPKLRALMHEVAKEEGVRYTDGVFLSGLGPSFETPAEIRAYKTLGADVVGMSMVAEVTAARHCDLKVSATAVVVNLASGLTDAHITHDETIHFSNLASENLTKLLKSFLRKSDSW